MNYVDGFIVAVKKDRLEEYRKLAELACKVWKEYGAIDYVEAVADDASLWLAAGFASMRLAQHEVDELFDTELIRLARQVQVTLAVPADGREALLPSPGANADRWQE